MAFFDNLKMRTKLFVLSGVSGAILVLAIVLILVQLTSVDDEVEKIAHVALPGIEQVASISQLRLRYRVRSLEYMLEDNLTESAKIEKSLEDLNTKLMEAIEQYRAQALPEDSELISAVDSRARAYADAVNRARDHLRNGNFTDAQQLRRTEWVQRANELRDATDALVARNKERGDESSQLATSAASNALRMGGIISVIGLVLAILLTTVISGRIVSRLRETIKTMEEIAAGNLATRLPEPSNDEVGTVIRTVGNMQSALHRTITQTRNIADQVVSSAREVKDNSNQVNESSEIQSSAASAIAANIEELTVSIAHVADRSSDAARLTSDSDREAQEGKTTVDRLIAGIQQAHTVVTEAAQHITSLETQSEQISHIVLVIREIAEQTNLLALNAAIEAARAGESGRGFAVVADEVRKLSERTAQSTQEIASMVSSVQHSTEQAVAGIERGVAAVTESNQLADVTGETMTHLQQLARQVANVVSEIDLALREQSTASAEVARRVEEIAAHASETSAATARAVHAAEMLDQEALSLQRDMQRFRL